MTNNWLDGDPIETQEWLDAFASLLAHEGSDRARFILSALMDAAGKAGINAETGGAILHTPYVNTLAVNQQAPYPGDLVLEKQIEALNRWNAIVMVLRAKKSVGGVGGHLSSYASIATLYEVGLNHFFRAAKPGQPGDLVYFQGHSSEGNYARAYLEGRLNEKNLEKFRQEIGGGGLSSYPHPWLMPDFWQFATVSLGLGPLQAIYQARFLKYLENRALVPISDRKVWVFAGDGEMDEVESVGALTVAVREKLDNIIYVVNCNLQRLDGLVRGNGKIVQELEGVFRGAGWHVIKVLWDSHWDAVFARDTGGHLQRRLGEVLDGELQHAWVGGGAALRQLLCGEENEHPEVAALLADYSDAELSQFGRGAHDPLKVFAAYQAAVSHQGQPVVILAQGVKGYGLGTKGAEGRNIAHNQLEMQPAELQVFGERFGLSLTEAHINELQYYRPDKNDPAIQYLHAQREKLNGCLPSRLVPSNPLPVLSLAEFDAVLKGSGDRTQSTTMVFSRILGILLKDAKLGPRVVPIFSDEVRTFGMEALFRQIGIYAPTGQCYTPEDKNQLVYYREDQKGQLLEEGITESGCMSSWIAAATAYSTHHEPMIPFFTYYSMFGFQRVGDLIWAAADMRARGFLIGATAGRTTLEGEGLQHQDGNSLLIASTYPSCRAYDPAFGFEMAVIVHQGLKEMLKEEKDFFYYIMAMNERYVQPPMPEGAEEGIIRGMYLFRAPNQKHSANAARVRLFGSGAILNEVLAAAELLENEYEIATEVWSVTSYTELRREGLAAERATQLGGHVETPWVNLCLDDGEGPIIAASDYVRALPDLIRPFVSAPYYVLGTDGYGRSDTRAKLRQFFGVDRLHIVTTALYALSKEKKVTAATLKAALKKFGMDPATPPPWEV